MHLWNQYVSLQIYMFSKVDNFLHLYVQFSLPLASLPHLLKKHFLLFQIFLVFQFDFDVQQILIFQCLQQYFLFVYFMEICLFFQFDFFIWQLLFFQLLWQIVQSVHLQTSLQVVVDVHFQTPLHVVLAFHFNTSFHIYVQNL